MALGAGQGWHLKLSGAIVFLQAIILERHPWRTLDRCTIVEQLIPFKIWVCIRFDNKIRGKIYDRYSDRQKLLILNVLVLIILYIDVKNVDGTIDAVAKLSLVVLGTNNIFIIDL